MGQVYQATDTQLGRDVALKILPDAFAADPDRLARFQREAQVLASLNHPGIAAIYGIEKSEDTQALVLELVEGPTLADRIAQGPIPIDEALPIAKQIAEALEAAHEQGIIHRDLKPANVKVKADGTVKVLDFGLAKAFQPDASDPNLSASPTISLTVAATQMGMVIGTAAYMAPEQAKGKPVGKQADVWAFGAVLYEMLTGLEPFAGDDASDTLALVLKFEPEWDAVPSDAPLRVRQLIQTCLQKDPKQRVQAMGDVRLAMEGAFETAVPIPTEPTAVPQLQVWQRPIPLAVAALGLVVIIGLAVWSATRPTDPPAESIRRFAIDLGPASPIPLGNVHAMPTWSPDGTRLVYAANLTGTPQLYLRALDELEAHPITGTEGAYEPFFSPDGEWVGFFTPTSLLSGELKRVSVGGGTPLTLCECYPPTGATWLADGTIIATSFLAGGGGWTLHRIPEAGGTPELLTTPDVESGEFAHLWPHALPGGTDVLFTIMTNGDGGVTRLDANTARLAVLSLDTGEYHVVIEGGYNARYVPTGHLVFGRQGALWGVPFDLNRLVTTGPEAVLLQSIEVNETVGTMTLSVSNDGSLVYLSGAAREVDFLAASSLVWVDREGGEEPVPLPLPLPVRTYLDPHVSPEGGRVAVVAAGDLWAYDLATGAGLQLTQDVVVGQPAWTPDGEHVVFSASDRPAGARNLYRVRADGSGDVERVTTSGEDQALHQVSPDGERLVYTKLDAGTEWELMTVPLLAAGEPRPLVTGPLRQAGGTVAPDGRWLAYRSDETGQFEIYAQPYPGPGPKTPVSIGGGTWSVWAPDGRTLFYESAGRLMARSVDTEPTLGLGSPEVVLDLSGYSLGLEVGPIQFDVSPEGDRFLLKKPVETDRASSDDGAAVRLTVVENWFEELKRLVPIDQ